MAKMYYFYGSMSCGKSLDLLKTAHNYIELGHDVLLFTSGLDNRFGTGKITSRIGINKDATIINPGDYTVLASAVLEIQGNPNIKAVFVDECQFLDEKQIDMLSDIVDYHDVTVFCYGIRTDFQGKLFTGSERLFEIADCIEELRNICSCGRKAIMNARMVQSTEKVLIGGNDVYKSMCRKCFKKHNG